MYFKIMFFLLLLVFYINNTIGFFTPQIKTTNGNVLKLYGTGSPVLFSPGLFGSMPDFFYGNLITELKKNNTIITINGFSPISKNTIEEICDTLKVDKIGYIGHSSFNPEILDNSKYINNALLIDPINIPSFNFNDGFNNRKINSDFPITIIKAKKLYYSSRSLPKWQYPIFKKKVYEEYYEDVGHPDILDNFWADIAKTLNLWDMAEREKMNYKEWKLKSKNSIPSIRKKYIEYISRKFYSL
jgi:hypothetical protein